MKRISLLLFFIGCFLFSLSATNYFVATNGSDSNSGTIDTPFATFNWAENRRGIKNGYTRGTNKEYGFGSAENKRIRK